MKININEAKTKSEMSHAFEIRRQVFITEQNVSEEIEMDEYDAISQHILAEIDGKPVGTARWRTTQEGVKLERFAVLSSFRRFHVGTELVKFALRENTEEKYIYLNAQEDVIPFYEKFGFETEGGLFYEANIPHKKMVLKTC